jgi:hypothetical protein
MRNFAAELESMKRFSKMAFASICLALCAASYNMWFGKSLCLIHMPIFVCGFICGKFFGLSTGILTAILCNFLFNPAHALTGAITMACELGVYGFTCGQLRQALPQKKNFLYSELIIAMLLGRVAWLVSLKFVLNFFGITKTFALVASLIFVNQIPGIILHIFTVPIIVLQIEKQIREKL